MRPIAEKTRNNLSTYLKPFHPECILTNNFQQTVHKSNLLLYMFITSSNSFYFLTKHVHVTTHFMTSPLQSPYQFMEKKKKCLFI